ncbi:hypothetical protein Pelo_5724 [Pelomyxa schiedti]|nr:hypothetical protein Pelo_5724 [Pelomyxa schiedti]
MNPIYVLRKDSLSKENVQRGETCLVNDGDEFSLFTTQVPMRVIVKDLRTIEVNKDVTSCSSQMPPSLPPSLLQPPSVQLHKDTPQRTETTKPSILATVPLPSTVPHPSTMHTAQIAATDS